jgi:hypothetical protein
MRTFFYAILVSILFTACNVGECETTTYIESTLLVDLTDEKLIDDVNNELIAFEAFAKKKHLLDIQDCGKSAVSLASISSSYSLKVVKAELELMTKNLTGREIQKRKNTDTIFTQLNANYEDLKSKALENPELMESTDIATVVAKAIVRLKNNDVANLFVFSDFITYTENYNFYRNAPDKKNALKVFKEMVGNSLFQEMESVIQSGTFERLYLITLNPPKKMSKKQVNKVHTFWQTVFSEMGVELIITDSLYNL